MNQEIPYKKSAFLAIRVKSARQKRIARKNIPSAPKKMLATSVRTYSNPIMIDDEVTSTQVPFPSFGNPYAFDRIIPPPVSSPCQSPSQSSPLTRAPQKPRSSFGNPYGFGQEGRRLTYEDLNPDREIGSQSPGF